MPATSTRFSTSSTRMRTSTPWAMELSATFMARRWQDKPEEFDRLINSIKRFMSESDKPFLAALHPSHVEAAASKPANASNKKESPPSPASNEPPTPSARPLLWRRCRVGEAEEADMAIKTDVATPNDLFENAVISAVPPIRAPTCGQRTSNGSLFGRMSFRWQAIRKSCLRGVMCPRIVKNGLHISSARWSSSKNRHFRTRYPSTA